MRTDTTTRRHSVADVSRQPETTTSVQRGALLGRYTILEAIGSGGMGNVFAAWDPELQRRVAIKVLHGELMLSPSREGAQDRLRKEAQAAARLAHPNVVAIYDVGTVGSLLFIAMELVEGQTLKSWSDEGRSWSETLDTYRLAGRGLEAAHRAGLVHRDFKPGNVMLSNDGQVKILDFGLAMRVASPKISEDQQAMFHLSDTLTRTDHLEGTPRYMSPEQLLGLEVDHRSDQFSFCVSLYLSLYGCFPFLGESEDEVQASLLTGKLRQPPQEADIPLRVHRALERGLKADAEDRYPTMSDLLDDLQFDVTPRWHQWLTAVVLAAIVTAMFFGLRPRAVTCEHAGRHLDATWNDERRRSLQEVFSGLDASGGWPRVAAGFDANILQLRTMYKETCEATYVRGEQSMELLDRRMACLEDRRRATKALLGLFEQGREDVLARAAGAVDGLPNIAACADRQALSDLTPPAPTEVSLALVDKVREGLADALALELAGSYGEALPHIETALAVAREMDYLPLIGEVQLQHARVVGRLGDSEGMKAYLIDAVSIALATHHRELLARAYLQLIVVGFLRGEVDNAHAFGRMAEATISTLSGRQDLEAERLFFLGMIALREGRNDDAVEMYERYLEVQDNISPLQEVTALNNLAEALRELGELEQAREALLRAEPTIDELAPQHEMRWIILGSLGEIYLASGDLDRAEGYLRRCMEGLEEVLGPQHPKIGNYLFLLARVNLQGARDHAAMEMLQAATAIHLGTPGYEIKPIERQWLLGRLMWEEGKDRHRALQLIRQAASALDTPGEETAAAEAATWMSQHGKS